MFLALLSLITALTISGVAIYYSVAGLVAIFAAAAVPIIIMGGALEIGKLVTAVWLHKHWERANWWLKTYLSAAVVILMFITSMGIFGFLSKAHIEQTAAAGEGVAQIEQIEKEIARQEAIVLRAEQTIEKTQTSGTGADQNIQAQIDREQERIDTAYDRVQPAIDATNQKLENDKEFFLAQLPDIDNRLDRLDALSNIDTTDEEAVKRLQTLVGARPDGAYGGGTARAVREYRAGLEAQREDVFAKVEELKATAQEEIARLRSRAESEIDDSNDLIGRLRAQLGQTTGADIDAVIDEQTQRITNANTELDRLTEDKFTLEAEYRKLEAEVGPIKYIAEFIYGDQADKDLLEEAVRWVIIVIIIVFDPLAVLLLIASQYTFNWYREGKENVTTEEESTPDDSGPSGHPGADDTGRDPEIAQRLEDKETEDIVYDAPKPSGLDTQQLLQRYDEWDNATAAETKHDVEDLNDRFSEEDPISKEEREVSNELSKQQVAESYTTEKKDTESSEKFRLTEEQIDELDKDVTWQNAKKLWKEDHPDATIKEYKRLYLLGVINKFPWEDYLDKAEEYQKKRSYIMKDKDQQIRKITKE